MPQPVETTRFIENSTTTCDYRALKACLERHQGDRAKCTAEWEAFQEACAIRRRKVQGITECKPCAIPSSSTTAAS